jgi:serine/threonine protein kinase
MTPQSSSASVTRILEQFTQDENGRGWIIEQLGEGVQAEIYAVQSQDRQLIRHRHQSVAVKLYRPERATHAALARAEFESLSRLHAALSGRTIHGWSIQTPAPLYVCESPLALVMTVVPGTSLSSLLLTGDDITPEVLESAARAVLGAMQTFWSMGQLHGDVSLDNILCDVVNKDLSFIDLGGPVRSFHRSDYITRRWRRWYPASHDLAYMLFDTVVRGQRTFGQPGFDRLQQMFTENVLRAFVGTMHLCEEKKRLLDEIRACSKAHLKNLDLSLSPRGMWHVLLRYRASRDIDRLLARVRRHAPVSRHRLCA